MNASDRPADARTRQAPPWWWGGRVAVAVLAVVAALAAFVSAPLPSQASHAADGDLLAWVASHDALDASEALVDTAAAAERHDTHRAGACRANPLVGLPASVIAGCELPKAAGDVSELEPPGAAVAAERLARARATLARSDAVPERSALQPPKPPPRS